MIKDKEILIEIGIRSKYRHHVTKQEKCSESYGWLVNRCKYRACTGVFKVDQGICEKKESLHFCQTHENTRNISTGIFC